MLYNNNKTGEKYNDSQAISGVQWNKHGRKKIITYSLKYKNHKRKLLIFSKKDCQTIILSGKN